MTSKTFACLAVVFTASHLRADSTDDAIVAAMNLSGASSYSWTTQINQNGRSSEIRGQTGDNGYSRLTFVGFSAAASPAHGGTSAADSGSSGGTNAVFLGDSKYVVETTQGWVTPSNDSSATDESGQSSRSGARSGARSGTGGGGMRGTGGGGGRSSIGGGSQRGRSGGGSQNSPASASPRLPAGINLPHEELAIVAANYTDTHLEEGVFSGKLTQSGADLLLVPPGSSQLPPKGSAGTFRLWIKDGAVTKYELKLTAETTPSGASVNGGFSETITVDLSNVGSTKFEVPDAAKRKLGV